MNRPAAVCLAFVSLFLAGCTTLPDSYTRGAADVWPRWGYRVTNETAESLDLEVIVHQYVFACTAADGQLELAQKVFLQAADRLGQERRVRLDVPPAVEIPTSHIRNGIDGICSMRAGKRLRVLEALPPLPAGAALAPLRWQKPPAESEWPTYPENSKAARARQAAKA